MRLPIEQYFVLNPSQITFLGGSRFQLHVPRINVGAAAARPRPAAAAPGRARLRRCRPLPAAPPAARPRRDGPASPGPTPPPLTSSYPFTPHAPQIFNLWIEPVVQVSVRTEGSRVLLEADNCRIRGCEAVERLRLDQRFCMRFVTQLTWRVDALPAAQPQLAGGGADSAGGRRAAMLHLDARPQEQRQQQQLLPDGEISGEATLDVWSEVLSPFNLMPRGVMEGTVSAVMRGLVGSLLPLFMRQLASDYGRWATDEAYRAERAARSKPLAG
jgi:hypothetical protein